MRNLSPTEMLSMRELLNMETTGLISLQTMHPLISDDKLKESCESGIRQCEARIMSMQQFVQENGIMSLEEVQ